MLFPTTNIIENFNRIDQGPPPSVNWSGDGTGGQFKVLGNQCVVNSLGGGYAYNFWNGASYGPDCEVFATISIKPANGSFIYIFARFQGASTTTSNGYSLRASPVSGTDTFDVFRHDNGVQTSIGSFSQEITNGDAFGLSCIGNTINLWYNPLGGNWSLLGSIIDATYKIAGNIGIVAVGLTPIIDDFGGGTIPISPKSVKSRTLFRKRAKP